MAIIERTYRKENNAVIDEVLISSDSHIIEPEGLWKKQLPKAFQDHAPGFGEQKPTDSPNAMDKTKRVAEMATNSISAEVLYPTHKLKALSLDDPELETACARVYNNQLIDYYQAAPDRLINIAILSIYDINSTIKEQEHYHKTGLLSSII